MKLVILFVVVFALSSSLALDNGLGRTPPMGWNTWCTLGKCGRDYCDEKEVYSVAQELVKNGMFKLGYNYVALDDCWADVRDAGGNITADKNRFPSGMKALADKVHTLGLKFGLYTCAGVWTCSSGERDHKIPGSYGHYEQDAITFASWDIDFVKMDWCNTEGLKPEIQYPQFSKALNKTGRPIFFEMCEWGVDDPWKWAAPYVNQWRSGEDHHDDWQNTADIIEHNAGLSSYSAPGAFGYMDFIYTGGQGCADPNKAHCPGMTDVEYRTEFSFWAFLNSGLIVATDIRDMTPVMKEALYNTEIIAVNQDKLFKQGDRVSGNSNTTQVWARPLADGSEAVILYNPTKVSATVTADFSLWGWKQQAEASVYDLWKHAHVGSFTGSYSAEVVSHGVVFVKLRQT